MMRHMHRWPGLLAAALLVVVSLSGATLSVMPALEAARTPAQAEADLSVAELAGRVVALHPGVEQIRRAPSGRITAYWFENGQPGAAVIDPATGAGVASADASGVQRWLVNLHRALFLDDGGRLTVAAAAALMLVISVSGLALLARRMGGWHRLVLPVRGPFASRLHAEIARIAALGLIVSSLTGLWMTASTFELLPDVSGPPAFPGAVSGVTGMSPAAMATLRDTPLSVLRALNFPYAGDASDVFTLKTAAGQGYLDQGTGALLVWQEATLWDRVNETIYWLHTGEGAPLWALVLGLAALGVPVLAWSGIKIWLGGRQWRRRPRGNARARDAQTVILVGSEGGTTWGFAETAAKALRAAGQAVHVGPMSGFAPDRYPQARRLILMAATYGDGDVPATARGFLETLAAMPAAPEMPVAVLGFGDRSFPNFCGYAARVQAEIEARGGRSFLSMDTVDRGSAQDFARWGRALSQAMGVSLALDHRPDAPPAQTLTLVARRDFGAEVQAPTAILRFALPQAGLWARLTGRAFGNFEAGDLLAVIPEGATLPRFYSLASGSRDGFVEICVKRHPGGLCSGQLTGLEVGDTIRAYLRPNPAFRPATGDAPVILIGAGTGIGPLAGFARANDRRRPMHLFFGARHPESDLLFGEDLARWQAEGRLSSVTTAFSRMTPRAHVQDALRADGVRVARLIADGAQVMVCGGRDMAAGVAEALAEILAPHGLSPAHLKAEGRYAEDVY
ncbi:PepSY domain-containing protein [Phaeovulum vinaykumarii]|uniref:NADPH--hemoprotein reductase n=1 Tax=Phaeovulum vinaykumarii TaxID=407234 RepID=A0A1N7M8W2_9RHOB|nr:PepSY domain-containing protein [Phaeovulum vinaykumarii]SIS82514.1 sulfite reductase (NADPH) flavoprotein alpha-component [Phaeovulum vinaykumarii]SOC10925.1 sulfite reductase (NADPH) flavoprotein alpha-component [Phaeovulum vinaykumarii]